MLVRQVEVARQLGMKKQNVSRAFKTLLEAKVLVVEEEYPPIKRIGQLRLNHKYAWKGKLQKLGLKANVPEIEDEKEREKQRKSKKNTP